MEEEIKKEPVKKEDFSVLAVSVSTFINSMIAFMLPIPVFQLVMGIMMLRNCLINQKKITREREVVFFGIAKPVAIVDIVMGALTILGLIIYIIYLIIAAIIIAAGYAAA